MKTAQDYLTAHPDAPAYVAKCLKAVEALLASRGWDWATVPPDGWEAVYRDLNITSVQTSGRYHTAVTAFYRWLDDTGALPARKSPYRNFQPIPGETLEIDFAGSCFASMDEMLASIHDAFSGVPRWDGDSIAFYQLVCALLWMQLTVPQIASLTRGQVVLCRGSAADGNADAVTRAAIHPGGAENAVVLTNRRAVVLLAARMEAMSPDQEYVLSRNGGAPYAPATLNREMHRFFLRFNELSGKTCTIRSIHTSGFYLNLYQRWQQENIPWAFCRRSQEFLSRQLGFSIYVSTPMKQKHFQRFLAYVSQVHGKQF